MEVENPMSLTLCSSCSATGPKRFAPKVWQSLFINPSIIRASIAAVSVSISRKSLIWSGYDLAFFDVNVSIVLVNKIVYILRNSSLLFIFLFFFAQFFFTHSQVIATKLFQEASLWSLEQPSETTLHTTS